MTLYSSLFSDPHAAALFTDRAQVQAMLDVEAALADAAAAAGLITRDAAATIRSVARADAIDLDALTKDAAAAGNLAIPLVRQLTARVHDVDPSAADGVHV